MSDTFELVPDLLAPATPAVPLVLRPYQVTDLARLRAQFRSGVRRVCYQAPTGSGKTVIFSEVVAGAVRRGNRVCILGHRDEIIQQISRALDALGVAHALVVAGCDAAALEHPVQVASVQTLVRRLEKMTPPDLIVPDECHHCAAATWRKILAAFPQAKVLGVTATPQRLDGKGLDDIFDALVIGPSVSELIAAGYLSPFAFAPARGPDLSGIRTRAGDYATDELAARMSKGVIISTSVDEYTRLCPGAAAIVYCVDIQHSELVTEAFRARGYRAAHLDGNTPTELRRSIIAALGSGELQVVSNCGLISEGLDVVGVVAVILLRPTKSLALYLQHVGRALRPAPSKKGFILDHAGNTFRFGPADAPQNWTLKGREKGEQPLPLQRCDYCGVLIPLACLECPECGAVLREPPGPRTHIERRGEALKALTPADRLSIMSYGQCLRWAGRDANRLRLVAAARGYKPGWVWHRLQELQEGEQ
jgi:superfamily II DNA or RNA helicase